MRPNSTKPTAKSSLQHSKLRRRLALGAMIAALALVIGSDAAQRVDAAAPDAREWRYVPNELLIRFASGAPDGVVEALARRLRLDRIASFTSDGVIVWRWRIPDRRFVPAVIRALEGEPVVLAVQPNYLYGLQEPCPAGGMGATRGAENSPLPPASGLFPTAANGLVACPAATAAASRQPTR
jgi:hypothetical protein